MNPIIANILKNSGIEAISGEVGRHATAAVSQIGSGLHAAESAYNAIVNAPKLAFDAAAQHVAQSVPNAITTNPIVRS